MFESLKKWNPFKFKRNKAEADTHALDVATSSTSTNPSTVPTRRGFSGYREMEQLFDRLWQNAMIRSPFQSLDKRSGWFGDFSPSHFSPKLDVVDDSNNLVITAELPGLSSKDVEVSVQEGVLLIKGEKRVESKHEEDGCYRTERAYGSFQRYLPLPIEVDQNKIEANFENGLLTLKLPKVEGKEPAEPILIQIQ